jgi:hypothetical protein
MTALQHLIRTNKSSFFYANDNTFLLFDIIFKAEKTAFMMRFDDNEESLFQKIIADH